jgi:hypothetical protein
MRFYDVRGPLKSTAISPGHYPGARSLGAGRADPQSAWCRQADPYRFGHEQGP